MVWVGKTVRLSTAIRTGSVAAIHFVLLALVLSAEIVIQDTARTPAITVEIVERPPPSPAPTPEAEPSREPDPDPAEHAPPEPVVETPILAPPPAPKPIAPETSPVEPPLPAIEERPAVLTQKDPTTAPDSEIAAAPPTATTGSDTVTPDQIAGVLRQLECQKLTHRTDESCPRTDPFTAWASNSERARVERNTDWDRSYRSKSTIDKFYEREVRGRLHWPDEDLFADPMAPGAYNADRIRRGQEPLWSKEVRDGFRKSDE
ncbi:MAG: hypothetical protein NXH88_10545 [Hyphomonas sp.]|nr:hypothetical protein [Hyphomonas sp.]